MQIKFDDEKIIAPCGINCSLCRAYVREHKPCPGCRGEASNKSNACLTCAIKNCNVLINSSIQFCYECQQYPCKEILHLDHRYRTKYGVSVMDNLNLIQNVGVTNFIAVEKNKWSCPNCGTRLSMHMSHCSNCDYKSTVTEYR